MYLTAHCKRKFLSTSLWTVWWQVGFLLHVSFNTYYTPRFNEVEWGVYIGFTLSVYRWNSVSSGAQSSYLCFTSFPIIFTMSISLWTESCPLCIFYYTGRIHFIFGLLAKFLLCLYRPGFNEPHTSMSNIRWPIFFEWIDRILGPLCDFDLVPYPWSWP